MWRHLLAPWSNIVSMQSFPNGLRKCRYYGKAVDRNSINQSIDRSIDRSIYLCNLHSAKPEANLHKGAVKKNNANGKTHIKYY